MLLKFEAEAKRLTPMPKGLEAKAEARILASRPSQIGCLSPESNQTKNLKSTYRRVQNLRIS